MSHYLIHTFIFVVRVTKTSTLRNFQGKNIVCLYILFYEMYKRILRLHYVKFDQWKILHFSNNISSKLFHVIWNLFLETILNFNSFIITLFVALLWISKTRFSMRNPESISEFTKKNFYTLLSGKRLLIHKPIITIGNF